MNVRARKSTSTSKSLLFLCGVLCIAAAGISAHFFDLQRQEKKRRITAESRLKDLSSQLQLVRAKNRDLAEQLREAQKIADELVREREQSNVAVPNAPPRTEVATVRETPEEVRGPDRVASTNFTEAADAVSLSKLALALGSVRDAAGSSWRTFRGSLTQAASTETPPPEPVATRESGLLKTLAGFRTPSLAEAAAKALQSGQELFGGMRTQLAARQPTTESPAPAENPVPAEEEENTKEEPPASPTGTTKLTATNEELQSELERVRQEKRELEKEIAERTGSIAGSVNVGNVRIATGRRFSGKILVVNPKYNFIVIDVGRNQGLEKGVVFIVHRGNTFIGKAEVTKLYETMAAADLVMDWMQDDVRVGDGVKKF
jgi:uncharacterized protein YlxW (UPF0749 family)